MRISMIVAVAQNLVIGKNNDLVWNLPDDMKYFKEKTAGHHVIMGRKNYESIPAKWRPLPNRQNVIITRNIELNIPDVIIVNSIELALQIAEEAGETEAFIIGGGEIFNMGLSLTDRIYYTDIKESFDGDTFFPKINKNEWVETGRIPHPKDDRHAVDFDFVTFDKIK